MGYQPPAELYPLIKGTFTITYIFLVTTGIVIFIEALRHGTGFISHIMNLETAISVVAAYFYGLFMTELEQSEKLNTPVDWNKMVSYRYIDWSITTPIMLFTLNNDYKIPVTNILDLISKCFVGLGLWAYYTKILTL